MMGVWRSVSVICKITFFFFFSPQLSNSEQKWWLKFIDYGYSYHSPYVEHCLILSLTQLGNVGENLCYSPVELGRLTAQAAVCKAAAKDRRLLTSTILAFHNTVAMQWIIHPCCAHLLYLGMVLLHNCWTYQIFVPGLVPSHVLSSVVGHVLETVLSPDFCMHWLCCYQSFHLKLTVDWRLTLKCLYPVYSYFHASMIDPWGTAGMFLGRAGIEVRLFLFFCPCSHCYEVITVLLKLWYTIQTDAELGANIFLAIIWFNFESFICCSGEKPWKYFVITRGKGELRKQFFLISSNDWLLTPFVA